MHLLPNRAPTWRALAVAAALAGPMPATAAETESDPQSIVVVAPGKTEEIENAPQSSAGTTAGIIAATVNATNIEDTVKYLPSLLVRKRHIGDTQAPLATRTSGVGASARSLIYADGVLLSSLIGNNNTNASPRWGMVSPQEVERIDVLYGPFSAAYAGNSIGAVVNITTRLPDKLEGTATVGTNVQRFDQYGTNRTLPAYTVGATLGGRFGPLSILASASHVTSNSQPLAYVTATRAAAGAAGNGGFDDVNRTGAPIRVIGAGGFEHQRQNFLKLKAALDITSNIRLTYVGGVFLNDTDSSAETYLFSPAGAVFTSPAIAASAFSNNVYRTDQRHWSHSLSAVGTFGRLDWEVIGSLYDFARDSQRMPSISLPGALAGGAGAITRLDGTGWYTMDAKAAWRSDDAVSHLVSFGFHRDRFTLSSLRYATADWRAGPQGALNLAARGKTRTDAVWLQDAWRITPSLVLTVGGRYEWWRAYDGFNFSLAPALSATQPQRVDDRFSPKASLSWAPSPRWKASLSFGQAWRFPTVTELYQAIATGPNITVPDPNLRPERARSEELAIRYGAGDSYIRLSLFNESITDALLSQSAPLVPNSPTLFNFVQNVDRVRTRGVELAFEQRDLIRGFDLAGSVTLADPRIVADAAFPAAIGKSAPQVPRRKMTIVATWRPAPAISLTAAGRLASRSFATIDNSDPVANTYQGFAGYAVVDLRAVFTVTRNWSMALGVDNVGNDKYFLFHPFPQRSFSAELTYRL